MQRLEVARLQDTFLVRKSVCSSGCELIITEAGERGSGKSVLLVQSVAYAIESGWIVLYSPRGMYTVPFKGINSC